jgi:hypothetical protein
VYLREAAVLALSEFPDELLDSENFTRYLPLVPEEGGRVLVQKGARLLHEIGQAPVSFLEINDEELADLSAGNDYVLRF